MYHRFWVVYVKFYVIWGFRKSKNTDFFTAIRGRPIQAIKLTEGMSYAFKQPLYLI